MTNTLARPPVRIAFALAALGLMLAAGCGRKGPLEPVPQQLTEAPRSE